MPVGWSLPAANGAMIQALVVSCSTVVGDHDCASAGNATVACGGKQCPTSSSIDVTDAVVGVAVNITVAARNSVGLGLASSVTTTPAVAPAPPVDVGALAGPESATVVWDPPEYDGGAPMTHYAVFGSPGGLTASVPAPPAGTTAATTFDFLATGTKYTFAVAACNAAGVCSPLATSLPVTPVAKQLRGTSQPLRGAALKRYLTPLPSLVHCMTLPQ